MELKRGKYHNTDDMKRGNGKNWEAALTGKWGGGINNTKNA